MRSIYSISILLLICCKLSFSQAALEITSNNENIRFYVMINEQQMNNFYETYVKISNLPAGRHKVRVVFEADTVADYVEKIALSANKMETYLVASKSKPRRILDNLGRDAGKGFNIGKHDSTFTYLVDSYYITHNNSGQFNASGSDIEVDTEPSKSTSVLPASKQRPGTN